MNSPAPRSVWITGAGSGIGYALALEFGKHGDRLALSGRRETLLNDLQGTIEQRGGKASVIICDVRDERSVMSASSVVSRQLGPLDILVNNAGVTVFKDFMSTTTEEFDDIMLTNLRGAFLTTKAVLPAMLKRRSGIILNIVSYAAKTTYTESSSYSASKAGIAAMMEGLRAEVRDKGIKIVNVFPGAVRTPIWHQKVLSKHGDRMMSPEELASMVYDVSRQKPSFMVEEIVIRPQHGDINA
jgi:3-oxoacyl-[acyl-carrier protein] reductase